MMTSFGFLFGLSPISTTTFQFRLHKCAHVTCNITQGETAAQETQGRGRLGGGEAGAEEGGAGEGVDEAEIRNG